MAYNFNGTNQFLTTASTPILQPPLTISAWFRVTGSLTAQRVIVQIGNSSGIGGEVYRIVIPANTFFRAIQIYGGLNGGTTFNATADTAPNTLSPNIWYHGVGVFESVSSRSVYLNGIFYTRNTTTLIPSIVANIHIGANFQSNLPNGGGPFAGNIADVGIWNTSLSSSEIFSLSRGITCDKIRPQNLSFYAPLIKDLQDIKGGLIITPNNGPIVATHPRIYK